MGFAWERANVSDFGLLESWDRPAPAPRHRKPRRSRHHKAARPVRKALAAARMASRRARLVLTARPALADHRRAF